MAKTTEFHDPAVDLAVSRPRSWADWFLFGFAKGTYVWLVWIPLVLLILGIGMNHLAVAMNHGLMPVLLPRSGAIAHKDKLHLAATADCRFLFLCDWIQLHATRNVASPGDYLIAAGDLLRWPIVWVWVGVTCGRSTWRKLIDSYANV